MPPFPVEPSEQGCVSCARVISIRRSQEQAVEVLTARYAVVWTTTWDRYFGCCADDVEELLGSLIHVRKSGGYRVLANLFVKAM